MKLFGFEWSGKGIGIIVITVAVAVTFLFPVVRSWSLAYPIAALVLFWLTSAIIAASINPFIIAVGADGRLSASKFQFFVWSGTVVFSYVWVAAIRALGIQHDTSAISGIPPNVMYAMGFSIVTLAGAKGITTGLAQGQRISKQQQTPTGDPADLLATDDGVPDLAKIQMLIWTVIAVCMYLIRVRQAVHADAVPAVLPDIDAPLMVLMGLGHAAYLGNKLTSSDVPTLTNLSPTTSITPCPISVSGSKLTGTAVAIFSIGGQIFQSDPVIVAAAASSVQFTLPTTIGTYNLRAGDRVDVSIIVDGVRSVNSLPFVSKGPQ